MAGLTGAGVVAVGGTGLAELADITDGARRWQRWKLHIRRSHLSIFSIEASERAASVV